ncbi:LytTR family transcriptional regulator [Listeria monocytogenes]|uniref:LytTR family DNA-binding domain-containing protein n=1 Tax=Listeria monocytogenes TaxID=1639 RepID=UPI0010DD7B0D|nr:LytTR family transcriptional regulator [Listeria monocytogenes]EIN6612438.1 LytTR family transcriptional regulator DNA-binding domain-containing protein [Listeria monocytogenes]TYU82797.1 LytTR family transcriptional regulator [Listeria monocytogenes]
MDCYITKNKIITTKIPLEEILYVISGSKPHQINVVTITKIYTSFDRLNKFELVAEHFIRCNKSCIVNLHQILSIERKSRKIIFKDFPECEIYCSRRLYKRVCTLWLSL